MVKASQMASYEKQSRQLLGPSTCSRDNRKIKPKWKPTYYKEYQGESMEIDKISVQEERRRKEQGSCFNCGQKGHLMRDCPNQKNEARVEERPMSAFKGKQQSFH